MSQKRGNNSYLSKFLVTATAALAISLSGCTLFTKDGDSEASRHESSGLFTTVEEAASEKKQDTSGWFSMVEDGRQPDDSKGFLDDLFQTDDEYESDFGRSSALEATVYADLPLPLSATNPPVAMGIIQQYLDIYQDTSKPIGRHAARVKERLDKLEPTLKKIADEFGVPLPLYKAMIAKESGGIHFTRKSGRSKVLRSYAGAIGYCQLMPKTAKALGVNPNDPIDNLRGGAMYLRELLDHYNGNIEMTLCKYNAGWNYIKGAQERAGSTDFWIFRDHFYKNKNRDDIQASEYTPKVLAYVIFLDGEITGYDKDQYYPRKDTRYLANILSSSPKLSLNSHLTTVSYSDPTAIPILLELDQRRLVRGYDHRTGKTYMQDQSFEKRDPRKRGSDLYDPKQGLREKKRPAYR